MATTFLRYSVGYDIGQKEIVACFLGLTASDEIKTRGRRKFSNTEAGIKQLRLWIEKMHKQPAVGLRMLMEVTGVYHERLLHRLHDWGYHVSLELGKRTKRYSQSLGIDTKNDPQDAYTLAHMALHQRLNPWKPVTKDAYLVRQKLRLREELIEARIAFGNRLHAVEAAHYQDRKVLQSLRRTVRNLQAEANKLEAQAQEHFEQDTAVWRKLYKIVDSLPGISILTGMNLVAETNGFSHITSRKQLTRYAGMDVIENQSGKFNGKTRISKQGNARIRKAMYMPTMTHIRCCQNSPVTKLYHRVLRRTGLHKKALIAAARKLLCLFFTLWKNDQPYDPAYHPKHHEPTPANQHQEHTQSDNTTPLNPEPISKSPQSFPNPPQGGSPDTRPGLHEIAPATQGFP